MDTHLIEHIIKIAEEKSITKAAEKLYLTQSALNQQLLKLERELGIPLFRRAKTEMIPTQAGEIYLKGAREILRTKSRTYAEISDLTGSYKGTLSIGMTPVRGHDLTVDGAMTDPKGDRSKAPHDQADPDMFVHVYPRFHKKYPLMAVVPYELNIYRMQPLIARGDIDFGFMTLFPDQETQDAYETLFEEEILLAVPAFLEVAGILKPKESVYPRLPLSELADYPFILLRKETTMRPSIDAAFRESGIAPHVLFETQNPSTILEMVRAGISCGIVAESTARHFTKGIRYFSFEAPLRWSMTASYQKGTALSRAARDFIDMAAAYWKKPHSYRKNDERKERKNDER